MDKIARSYKMGCIPTYQVNQMPCGQPIYGGTIVSNLMCCDIAKLASRLKEYEDLDMTPEEIRQLIRDSEEVSEDYLRYRNRWIEDLQILEDGEDLADAYIKYRNRCVELEEENETLKKTVGDLQVDFLNEYSKYQAKSDKDEKEIEELKKDINYLSKCSWISYRGDKLEADTEEETSPEVKEIMRKARLYDRIVEALLGIFMEGTSSDNIL